jgi:hypothetical protein
LLTATVWTGGCENTNVTVPTDGQIILTANPSTINIDRSVGQEEGSTTITAQVFDGQGFALKDVALTFTTSGGTLQSSDNSCEAGSCRLTLDGCLSDADCPPVPATPVETDKNGIAFDLLTLSINDPASVQVEARSGTVASTVTVTRTTSTGNNLPFADIQATPANEQRTNQAVTFNGSGSFDPDDDPLTCYQWTIDSSVSASDEVVQGSAASLINRTYAAEQKLQVILRVSDVPNADCPPAPPADPTIFSPNADNIEYLICDNTAPTADAGPDQSGSPNVPVQMVGDATDPEGGLLSYQWNCGNNEPPLQGRIVSCVYASVGNFVATLTVTDSTTLPECQLSSTDTASVTINN